MSVVEELQNDEIARELLVSRELARLAYNWFDGTPRVVPVVFHWTGPRWWWRHPSRRQR